jgi:hypothetical protein
VEAAGVSQPPSIPTKPQLPEASAMDREGMIVRPDSAVNIEATALTSTLLSREKQGQVGSSPGAMSKKRTLEEKNESSETSQQQLKVETRRKKVQMPSN